MPPALLLQPTRFPWFHLPAWPFPLQAPPTICSATLMTLSYVKSLLDNVPLARTFALSFPPNHLSLGMSGTPLGPSQSLN